ncbi:uncharacterized protein N7483_005979 [Penicillium malachiteum]|uniref:uncharacterized protein n=1 Tax=Penicillium malachiteum TaxID=1324776 RepID=UPI002548B0A7|nr:uncharacterized protein N7483_005979 [Penicillium malachiteum]KAJ5731471.1 hypothetical protein N7483_005979 [Penicillium malachiteum]
MSDPFSVAGSAVGVISLALSICGKIVDYGRAYRGYDEDIHNITAKAKSLNETLEALEEAIKFTQATQPKATTDLSTKVIGIKETIARLKSMLKRYRACRNHWRGCPKNAKSCQENFLSLPERCLTRHGSRFGQPAD